MSRLYLLMGLVTNWPDRVWNTDQSSVRDGAAAVVGPTWTHKGLRQRFPSTHTNYAQENRREKKNSEQKKN